MSDEIRYLTVQWHITEKCNLRCKHCYQESYNNNELNLQDLFYILEQLNSLRKIISEYTETEIKCRLNITGGEPFIRTDFFDLLNKINQYNEYFIVSILTNGLFINKHNIEILKDLSIKTIQVSIEGTPKTHDAIRGNENFSKVSHVIKLLVASGIYTSVSFTAHLLNYKEFPEVVRLVTDLGADDVWTDRLIPYGTSSNMNIKTLTTKQTKEYINLIRYAQKENIKKGNVKTKVKSHRALQFLNSGNKIQKCKYLCKAGGTLITILSNGDLVPCRRMPIFIGNILKESLVELYLNNSILSELRDRTKSIKGCELCQHKKQCFGGLRCLSYAINKDPFVSDPGCWLSK